MTKLSLRIGEPWPACLTAINLGKRMSKRHKREYHKSWCKKTHIFKKIIIISLSCIEQEDGLKTPM